MIVREWRGRTLVSMASLYPEHFRGRVLPELGSLEGFLGATLLRRSDAEGVEFVVLTKCRSMEAIIAFAGADVECAVVEPEAAAALVSFDRTARHYEVVEGGGH